MILKKAEKTDWKNTPMPSEAMVLPGLRPDDILSEGLLLQKPALTADTINRHVVQLFDATDTSIAHLCSLFALRRTKNSEQVDILVPTAVSKLSDKNKDSSVLPICVLIIVPPCGTIICE